MYYIIDIYVQINMIKQCEIGKHVSSSLKKSIIGYASSLNDPVHELNFMILTQFLASLYLHSGAAAVSFTAKFFNDDVLISYLCVGFWIKKVPVKQTENILFRLSLSH